MGATEWVLLIVVVILIPLAIAVAVTLWSLEQARQRNRRNRPGAVRRVAAPDRSGGASSTETGTIHHGRGAGGRHPGRDSDDGIDRDGAGAESDGGGGGDGE